MTGIALRIHRKARALAAALLWLALATPGAIAQEEPAVASRAPWKTVVLGERKGPNQYRAALDAAAIKLGDSANEILGRPAFPYAREPREVALVVLTGRRLGMQQPEPLAQLYRRARLAGLALCPAEVGPQLRLAYRDQPRGQVLHVAMEPVATWSGAPTILALANFGTPLLIGSNGSESFMVPPRFVFALPDPQGLQARGR